MSIESTADGERLIGEQIRALRIAQLMDQKELAARANVRAGTISSLERGEGSTLGTLVRVVRALGRTDWLLALDPVGDEPSPIEQLREQRRQRPRPQRVPRKQD